MQVFLSGSRVRRARAYGLFETIYAKEEPYLCHSLFFLFVLSY